MKLAQREDSGHGQLLSPSDGQLSPVTFLRMPRSSSSQAALASGSAAQEWPVVLSAARSATQARSWPSTPTSCHQDEALKVTTSRTPSQAGDRRQHTGNPETSTRNKGIALGLIAKIMP